MIEIDEITKKRKKKVEKMLEKKIGRLFRRCASMMKIATCILILIFMFGVLEEHFEANILDAEDLNDDLIMTVNHRMDRSVNRKTGIYDEIETPLKRPMKNANHNDVTKTIETYNSKELNERLLRGRMFAENANKCDIDYKEITSRKFKEREERERKEWTKRIQQKVFLEFPPNPSVIFHNKLPKSGSSTMNNILKMLSRQHKFGFRKIETTDSNSIEETHIVEETVRKASKPFVLLKHQRFFKFKRIKQPTFINVIREPLEWFTSKYYFSRYGWERKPGCRKLNCGMTEEEQKMEIDECVAKRHRECLTPYMYIQFFCGMSPPCFNITTFEQKRRATEIAKSNILNEYFMIGILEQFRDSLKLLETLLPNYFSDAIVAWKSEFVQRKQNMTRTTYKRPMNEKSRKFFRDGPLHFEIELYDFAREVFNERLKRLNIQPSVE